MWRTSFRNKTFENSVLSIDGNDGGVSEDEFACEVTNKFKQTLLHSIHTQGKNCKQFKALISQSFI